jgi:hypothetical protein
MILQKLFSLSHESLALVIVILVALAATSELACEDRTLLVPSSKSISVFIISTICASTVVYLGNKLLKFAECRVWLYPTGATTDEGESFVECEPDPSPPSPPMSPRVPSTLQPSRTVGSSTRFATPDTPRTTIWNPQASSSAFVRPTHHSGILGPSPHPFSFFDVDNDASRISQGQGAQAPRLNEADSLISTAHPLRFGYKDIPTAAGSKHFSGLGFVEQREKLRGSV